MFIYCQSTLCLKCDLSTIRFFSWNKIPAVFANKVSFSEIFVCENTESFSKNFNNLQIEHLFSWFFYDLELQTFSPLSFLISSDDNNSFCLLRFYQYKNQHCF